MTKPISPVHWAEVACLDNLERDCITAVVLKVLDAKCKMPSFQQEAVLAVYDTLDVYSDGLFGPDVHQAIQQALSSRHIEKSLGDQIHKFRLDAEANIAKLVMKAFKARLQSELFETDS